MQVTTRGKNEDKLSFGTFSTMCLNSNDSACRTEEFESVKIGEIFSNTVDKFVAKMLGCAVKSSLNPLKASCRKLLLW